ncbi:MAG: GNAT family N-acetyltransferase [Actinomycetota bacterium]
MIEVRPGAREDLARINEIYNFYIRTSHCTFDTEEHDMARRETWFEKFGDRGRYQLFVGTENGHVVGFAYSGRFRDRAAYSTSVETSVYTDDSARGTGIGRAVYDALFASLKNEDVHRMYAGIALPNDASIALHERFGFERVAHFSEQGRKFGRYWDVDWFERRA